MRFYTDLREVFRGIGNRQTEFNWLISDLEWVDLNVRYDRPPAFSDMPLHWVSGDALSQIVDVYELQFVWAVLSGFKPGVALDSTSLKVEPYADGNPNFWTKYPRIQHPLAEIEIVCWDSGATLLLCKDQAIGESFRDYFPEAVDLVVSNRSRR